MPGINEKRTQAAQHLLQYLTTFEIELSQFKTKSGNFTEHMKYDGIVFAQLSMKYNTINLNPYAGSKDPYLKELELLKKDHKREESYVVDRSLS